MKKFLFFVLLLTAFNAHARTGFLESLGLGSQSDEPPLVEDAFQFDAVVDNAHQISARWRVMEGNYLYRDKLRFETDNPAVNIEPVNFPAGENKQDETFGLVEVYHHDLLLPLVLTRQSDQAETITLTAHFQGCSETFGICYPPSQQQITLELPAVTDSTKLNNAPASVVETTTTAPLAEQDQIAQKLVDGKLWQILLGFLGLGLLLTFTPCVLPMIPILSSIIVGEGKHITTRRAFALSLVYVLSMSVTYTIAGIITGLLGANLQTLFQNVWVISAFSLLFVLLALSMFGLYELQLPQRLQNKLHQASHRQQGGKWFGVAIMGFLSGLIVGPCLAPPLAGALIFISQSADPLLGGLALFALSMGMGIPLLIIGTSAGKLIPKAGGWMVSIKSIFGVLLLGLAIWMLDRVIPGWVTLLLWGALLLVSAIYLGALTPFNAAANGWYKLRQGIGFIFLVYGTLLVIGGASGSQNVWQPLKHFGGQSNQTAEHSGLSFQRINNADDLERVLSTTTQPVMLDFYADWCVDCKIMEETTFKDPQVVAAFAHYQLIQLDMTDNTAEHQALLKQLKVFGPPTMLFFNANGEEYRQQRIVGHIDADKLLQRLNQLQ